MQPRDWFERRLQEYKDDPEFQTELLLLDINEQIVERMVARGIRRSELAQRLGSSRAFVTQLLNGKPNLTIKTLVQVANALDMAVNVQLRPRYLQHLIDWQRLQPCGSEGWQPPLPTDKQVGVRDESALAA